MELGFVRKYGRVLDVGFSGRKEGRKRRDASSGGRQTDMRKWALIRR